MKNRQAGLRDNACDLQTSSQVCRATYAAHDSEEPDASIFRAVKTVIAS